MRRLRMRELLPWRDLAIETSWPPSVAAIEAAPALPLAPKTGEPYR